MRCDIVLLFIGAAVLAYVGGSVLHRQERQAWSFPDDPVTQVNIPARPDATSRTTRSPATTTSAAATSTARPGVMTSTPPSGVIFQVKDCNCPATPQYNPVCGTDGNTYVNRQKLNCARSCGYDVQEARLGSC